MAKVYEKPCPCIGCDLRDGDCHCPNKCHKGDDLYQKWKATGVELPSTDTLRRFDPKSERYCDHSKLIKKVRGFRRNRIRPMY
jgi:hypothetical protein